MIMKFQTIISERNEMGVRTIDPKINSSKHYKIGEYAEDWSYVLITEIADEDAAAFRNYVGYIEDYTEDE
jgi:hypothetical protein